MTHFRRLNFFVVALLLSVPLYAVEQVQISTARWAPYINDVQQPAGSAAEILRQIFSQDDIEINWLYQNFDLAYEQVKSKNKLAAFPYLKTVERNEEVYFSRPVFQVVSRIYYNRQKTPRPASADGWPVLIQRGRVGAVAGYRYGDGIDELLAQAEIFPSDYEALTALLNNRIDFLPMTESVMNTLLNSKYQSQSLLVQPVEEIISNENLYLIAARTEQGEALISRLNKLISQAEGIQSLHPQPVSLLPSTDIAHLVTAEGYPAVIGQTNTRNNAQFYTLPAGTQVLVLKWSDNILKAANGNHLYRTMMDLSLVVVLNGPHVGKELYVKNMHIELL